MLKVILAILILIAVFIILTFLICASMIISEIERNERKEDEEN